MYNLAKKLVSKTGYSAPMKALAVSAPQVYIISRRLLGGEFDLPGISTPTPFIPSNLFEQITTGAAFPGAATSLMGSLLKLGDRLAEQANQRFGIRVPFRKYLNYAIPAVGGTLLWDGAMALLRTFGVEGAERPGLIPFDAAVAATLSTGYAYLADNARTAKRVLGAGVVSLLVLAGAYGFENSRCKPVASCPRTLQRI